MAPSHTRPLPRPGRCPSRLGRAAPALLLALCGACQSPLEHALNADEAAYRIVASRRAELAADAERFSIERSPDQLRLRLLEQSEGDRQLEPMRLAQALEIAAENSRAYQSQRESLYLAALDLTLERFRFAVQTNGSLAGALSGEGAEATDADVGASAGFSKLLGSGARIVGGLGLDLFRNLLSGDGWDAISRASFSFTQPLLAGYGRAIVEEPLTQAERDVVYGVRSFERFRRTFAFDVATRVYRILQQHDSLENERANAASLANLRERNVALARAGRLSDVQVDQARQDELRAQNRVIDAEQRLEGLYDEFKLFLGLPVETRLSLDGGELLDLVRAGVAAMDMDEAEATALALELRLDHLTVLDRVDDARRRVDVSRDALRGVLDVDFDASFESEVGKPFKYSSSGVDWRLGLDLQLPFERLPERNRYRESLIALEAAVRAAEQSRDDLLADVRDALRELAGRSQSFAIQQNSVQLAERRVLSTRLNFEAGRAETRDLLEAQNALLEARNALTGAIVDHRLAVLALYRDVELLRVDRGGLEIDLSPLERLRSGLGTTELAP